MKRTLISFHFLLIILSLGACVTSSKSRRQYFKVTVQKNDTLADLAQRYDTTWKTILKDNSIAKDDGIYVGQVLKVYPGPGGWPASSSQRKARRRSSPTASKKEGLLFNSKVEGAFLWPVKGGISSGFGPRDGRPHEGIDIRANRGSPIKAAASGVVIFSGWKSGYGNTIIIRHPSNDYSTLYAHCLRLKVKVGQRVSGGRVIGSVGRSGRATGYHVHFEIRNSKDTAKNPLAFLDKSENFLSSL